MRLIDADALKKALNYVYYCEYIENKSKEGIASDIIEEIDNAPTVEPCYQTTSCLDCKNYDKANYYCPRFCEVIREIAKENQRPQGEWITREDNSSFVHQLPRKWIECPFCGWSFSYDRIKDRFCSWCGADMRKEEK